MRWNKRIDDERKKKIDEWEKENGNESKRI